MDPRTERALIRRAKTGDGGAMEALIRGHQDSLYAFILRLCRRPDIAQDIVQEAMVRVLQNLDRFDPRFRFSTWLFTIAKRLYVNSRQKLSPSFDSDLVELRSDAGDQGSTPEGRSAAAESIRTVRTLLDAGLEGLSEPQRQIILLFHQQNWPITEIASFLEMPEGTVKSHLHRARRRMREVILSDVAMRRLAGEVWS